MSQTIPQALLWWQQRLGHSIQFPVIPPACAELMDRARAAGIPVGTLYLVSRPLAAGQLGTSDWETGDLCCCYEASRGEEGQREVLQTLVILLAGRKLRLPRPHTIAQEWEGVQRSIEEGYALAGQWGYRALLTEADVTRLLTRQSELAFCHHLAADLAGTPLPHAAHQAYTALSARCSAYPQIDTHERLAEALQGSSPDPQINTALTRFDRSLLRPRWAVTSTRDASASASFGALTVPPSPPATQLLRAACAQAARWPHEAISERAQPLWYQEVAEETDLAVLIRIWNGWLIETHPEAAVRLTAWAYGDGYRVALASPTLYRVSLAYEDAPAPIEGPATRDLWVLFAEPPTPQQRALEAAWQIFLADWLTWSALECTSLSQGLQHLWLQGGLA